MGGRGASSRSARAQVTAARRSFIEGADALERRYAAMGGASVGQREHVDVVRTTGQLMGTARDRELSEAMSTDAYTFSRLAAQQYGGAPSPSKLEQQARGMNRPGGLSADEWGAYQRQLGGLLAKGYTTREVAAEIMYDRQLRAARVTLGEV